MVKTPSEFGNGFGRNDAMAEAGRCLADGGVLESFRASDISKNYRQRERRINARNRNRRICKPYSERSPGSRLARPISNVYMFDL